MRIAIDCRSILLKKRTGIGRATYHLLDSLGQMDHVNEYALYAPKRLFDFKRQLPPFSRYKNFKRHFDFFHQGPGKVDVYHLPSPGPVVSTSGRLVVTIHDLIYKMYPQGHTSDTIALTHQYLKDITQRADHIICASENTHRDLHASFNFPLEKSSVVYNGVDRRIFYPLSAAERQKASSDLKGLGVDRPYILFVGTIEPRKNLAGLLESFAMLKTKKLFHGQLVIAGMQGWMAEDLQGQFKELAINKDVIWAGFVSDEVLCQLYNMAEVFVFPSFYEGFGLPIVEAFSCGAPVVTSNNSSCSEMAGHAALTVDPKDPAAIAKGIAQILQTPSLQKQLRQEGLKRAQEFSLEAQARQTLKIYQQTANL